MMASSVAFKPKQMGGGAQNFSRGNKQCAMSAKDEYFAGLEVPLALKTNKEAGSSARSEYFAGLEAIAQAKAQAQQQHSVFNDIEPWQDMSMNQPMWLPSHQEVALMEAQATQARATQAAANVWSPHPHDAAAEAYYKGYSAGRRSKAAAGHDSFMPLKVELPALVDHGSQDEQYIWPAERDGARNFGQMAEYYGSQQEFMPEHYHGALHQSQESIDTYYLSSEGKSSSQSASSCGDGYVSIQDVAETSPVQSQCRSQPPPQTSGDLAKIATEESLMTQDDMEADEKVKRSRPHSRYMKTKMCAFFRKNRCKSGSDCPFSHTTGDLRQPPDFAKTKLCSDFVNGNCLEPDCRFAHGFGELRFTKDRVYKV